MKQRVFRKLVVDGGFDSIAYSVVGHSTYNNRQDMTPRKI